MTLSVSLPLIVTPSMTLSPTVTLIPSLTLPLIPSLLPSPAAGPVLPHGPAVLLRRG